MVVESLVRVIAQQDAHDARDDRKDTRLGLEVLVGRFGGDCSVHHEKTRDGDHEQLAANFLLDAFRRLRVKLPLREVVALGRLVELLDLPPQMVGLPHHEARSLRAWQRGEQDPWIVGIDVDAHHAKLEWLHASTRVSWRWVDSHPTVYLVALLKLIDSCKAVRLGHANDELDAPVGGGQDPPDSGGQSGGEDRRSTVDRRPKSRRMKAEAAKHICRRECLPRSR